MEITLAKLQIVLNELERFQVSGYSTIGSDSSGELKLSLTTQPVRKAHLYLLEKGFVFIDGLYIYCGR